MIDDWKKDALDEYDKKNQSETSADDTKEVLKNNDNDAGDVGQKSTDEPPTFTDDHGWKWASEILGKDIKSKEDLVIKEEVEKAVEREYKTEFAKKYDEYFHETGRSEKDFIMLQRDLTDMTKEQVIKENLKMEFPELSQQYLNRKYNKMYGIDEELMSEEEIEDVKMEMELAYSKGKKNLESQKEKYLIPTDEAPASKEAALAEQQAKAEEANRLWVESVEKTNKELSSIDIKLSEDISFQHSLDEGKKATVKDIASDPSLGKFSSRYLKEDGTYDPVKYQRDIYILENFESIIAQVAEQAQAKQKEADIRNDKNIDFKSDRKPDQQSTLSQKEKDTMDVYNKMFKR